MAIESATYIDDLVATNPLATDPRSEGDDHIRLLKAVLQATFPNITEAVNPTPTELNYLVGVTSGIQTQLNVLNSGKASIPGGTPMLFYQASAPTYWTKVTAHNNKALRVVSGTGGGSGGSQPFTTAFNTQSITGSVGYHSLTVAELPPHSHHLKTGTSDATGSVWAADGDGPLNALGTDTDTTGSGAGHTHTFTGNSINLAVQYIDLIICTRD